MLKAEKKCVKNRDTMHSVHNAPQQLMLMFLEEAIKTYETKISVAANQDYDKLFKMSYYR